MNTISLIKIFDLTGNLVLETESTESIDISDLAPSIYFLEFEAGLEIYRCKFIKR